MKDFLGYEVSPGDHFCYPLGSGSSVIMAIYQFISENEGKVKAKKIESTGGIYKPSQNKIWDFDIYKESGSGWRDMTPEELVKAEAKEAKKTSILHCFSSGACKIDYKGRAE